MIKAHERESLIAPHLRSMTGTVHRAELLGILAYNLSKSGSPFDPISIGSQDLHTLLEFQVMNGSWDHDHKEYQFALTEFGRGVLGTIRINDALLESSGTIEVTSV